MESYGSVVAQTTGNVQQQNSCLFSSAVNVTMKRKTSVPNSRSYPRAVPTGSMSNDRTSMNTRSFQPKSAAFAVALGALPPVIQRSPDFCQAALDLPRPRAYDAELCSTVDNSSCPKTIQRPKMHHSSKKLFRLAMDKKWIISTHKAIR
jgi:hypothetical protein